MTDHLNKWIAILNRLNEVSIDNLDQNYIRDIEQEFNALDLSIIEKEKQQNFWLNDILNTDTTKFVASQEGINTFDGSFIILLIIALLAGFVSFASPCSLPILPAYVAYSFKS